MRIRADERGVTVQVGTVLLFAVLIILLSTYQAKVVPQANAQVEHTHNQEVQGQLQDLRDEIHRTAATGSGGSASVALGTQYPVRALFVNPPPASGTLRTTELGSESNVTIANAVASGETRDFWNGATREFRTKGLVYEPDYNVYRDAPTTVYANGVLYNRFDGADVVVAGQQLVRGNTISLVTVNGTLSKSSSQTLSVSPTAVSASTRTVTVRNESADENVSVVVPTTMPAEKAVGLWKRLLADQMTEEGPDKHVQAVREGPRDRTVRIALEPGTYQLRLSTVGVGTDVSGVDPHYVTDVSGDNASVAEASSQKLVVEVRDRFNNPVSDARVNATLLGGLSGDEIRGDGAQGTTLTNLETDGEGRVEIRYLAPTDFDGSNAEVTVRVSATHVPTGSAFAPGSRMNLSYNLTAVNTDGSGLGGGGDGGEGAYQVRWNAPSNETDTSSCTEDSCTYDAGGERTLNLTAWTAPTTDGADLRFDVSDRSVATVAPSGTTNDSGNATTTLVANENGTVKVYASGGGTGDTIEITVTNGSGDGGGDGDGGGPTGETTAFPDEYNDIDYNPGEEADENNDIPPGSAAVGELTNFGNFAADDGATANLDQRDGDVQLGVATYNVSQAGISYELELQYNLPSYSGPVNLQIVTADGSVLQTESLAYTSDSGYDDVSITLGTAAETYVKNEGSLYVVYRKSGGGYVQMRIDYQRLVVTTN